MLKKIVKITEKEFNPKKHIKEIKCKCNQCGKVWHYLESTKKSIESQQLSQGCAGCATFGSPVGSYFFQKSKELDEKKEAFDKCPNCGSIDVTKSVLYYEK